MKTLGLTCPIHRLHADHREAQLSTLDQVDPRNVRTSRMKTPGLTCTIHYVDLTWGYTSWVKSSGKFPEASFASGDRNLLCRCGILGEWAEISWACIRYVQFTSQKNMCVCIDETRPFIIFTSTSTDRSVSGWAILTRNSCVNGFTRTYIHLRMTLQINW